MNLWLVAVIALTVALLALGAWVLVDRTGSSSTPAAALAPAPVVAMLEGRIAAWDSGNGKATAAFYTKDAIMEERDVAPAVVTSGREAIGSRLQWIIDMGLRMKPVGTPVQIGRFVGEPVRFYTSAGARVGEAVLVFELAKDGKIAHQWVIGEVRG
jgi:hypothetical protein